MSLKKPSIYATGRIRAWRALWPSRRRRCRMRAGAVVRGSRRREGGHSRFVEKSLLWVVVVCFVSVYLIFNRNSERDSSLGQTLHLLSKQKPHAESSRNQTIKTGGSRALPLSLDVTETIVLDWFALEVPVYSIPISVRCDSQYCHVKFIWIEKTLNLYLKVFVS